MEKVEIKNHDLVELQKKVDEAYRTDHLTMPNVPKGQDPEADAESDRERARILNPASKENAEIRARLVEGRPAEGASPETLASIGKHKIVVGENETAIIEKPDVKVETNTEVILDREGLPVPVSVLEEKAVDDKASEIQKPINTTDGKPNFTDSKPTDFTALMDKKK